MIHDLTFPSSCDQVSKTLEEKRGKKLEKRSLLCHSQLHVRPKVGVMTLTLNLSLSTKRGAGGSRGAQGDPRITCKTYGWAFQRGRFQRNMRKNFQLLEKSTDGLLVVQSSVSPELCKQEPAYSAGCRENSRAGQWQWLKIP